MEIEPAEKNERAKLRGNIAPEILPGDGDANDARIGESSDVRAGNARPATRIGIVLIPIGEGRRLIDGGLEGEEREAIGSESFNKWRVEDEEWKEEEEEKASWVNHGGLN